MPCSLSMSLSAFVRAQSGRWQEWNANYYTTREKGNSRLISISKADAREASIAANYSFFMGNVHIYIDGAWDQQEGIWCFDICFSANTLCILISANRRIKTTSHQIAGAAAHINIINNGRVSAEKITISRWRQFHVNRALFCCALFILGKDIPS